jgi:prevent-host-death family protein
VCEGATLPNAEAEDLPQIADFSSAKFATHEGWLEIWQISYAPPSDGRRLLDAGLYGLYSRAMNKSTIKIAHKGSEEARNELPTLLEDAEGGRATIITRRGRPVAALVPLAQYRISHRQQSLLTMEGSGRGMWGKNSGSALGKMRDEWSR